MVASIYYAMTDDNGVLCVDRLDDMIREGVWTVEGAAGLAAQYPDTIYFVVDNVVPETRVPAECKPLGWFLRRAWPSCACGYAPRDNTCLIKHWEEQGFTFVDHDGRLVRKYLRRFGYIPGGNGSF